MSASNPELEAAILRDPEDADAYLVYGDWLQRLGDPRGELIALQHARLSARGDEATALDKQISALLEEHRDVLLGSMADALDEAEREGDLRLEWHLGFIRTAWVGQQDEYSSRDITALMKQLLTQPSARFLQGLTVGTASFEPPNDYGVIIDALLEVLRERGGSKTLRSLFVGDFKYSHDVEISASFFGDVSPLYALLPGLRSLRLRGTDLRLGNIDLPELREFTVETAYLRPPALESIFAAKWPKLEKLEVWFGVGGHGAERGVKDVQPFLDGKGLPNLKSLGLCNAEFVDELCKVLPEAKVLPQLKRLDLSRGMMSDEGARLLAKNASAFAHLEHLDVSENTLTDEGASLLTTLCPSVRVGYQRDSDEDSRYVAVSE